MDRNITKKTKVIFIKYRFKTDWNRSTRTFLWFLIHIVFIVDRHISSDHQSVCLWLVDPIWGRGVHTVMTTSRSAYDWCTQYGDVGCIQLWRPVGLPMTGVPNMGMWGAYSSDDQSVCLWLVYPIWGRGVHTVMTTSRSAYDWCTQYGDVGCIQLWRPVGLPMTGGPNMGMWGAYSYDDQSVCLWLVDPIWGCGVHTVMTTSRSAYDWWTQYGDVGCIQIVERFFSSLTDTYPIFGFYLYSYMYGS